MNPISVEMYAPVISSETQSSLSVVNRVRLQHTRSQKTGEKGANDALLDNADTGGFSLEMAGVTSAIKEGFKGGKKYIVTVTEAP